MANKKHFFIHPLFLFCILFYCFIFNTFYVLAFLCAVLAHEYAHYVVALRRGIALNDFSLMPYGARLNLKQSELYYADDVAIALAGPAINLVLAFVCVGVWWVVPEVYAYTDVFMYANLMLAFFNLLPLLPLDGARVVLALCSKNNRRSRGHKVLVICNYVAFGVFAFLFLLSIFFSFNLTFGIIALFVLFATFDSDNELVYQSVLSVQAKSIKKNKPLQVKTYCISGDSDVRSIYKLLNPNYYIVLIVMHNNGKKSVVLQSDFEKFFNK